MAVAAEQIRAYVDYLRELGIHDFYRCGEAGTVGLEEVFGAARAMPTTWPRTPTASRPAGLSAPDGAQPERAPSPETLRPGGPTSTPAAIVAREPLEAMAADAMDLPEVDIPKPVSFDALAPLPELHVSAADRASALTSLRQRIGDCTRCPLAYAGRRKIVFGN